MKKISVLMPIGLLIISASFFIERYMRLTDFLDGMLKGIGIGFILLALYKQRLKLSSDN